ncbi:MAG TPA: TonB-dependent receptor, partial [Chitinophaga sp.]
NRIEGEHSIGKSGIKFDWSGDMINTRRDQPDTRYSLGVRSPKDPEGYYAPYLGERNGFLGTGTSMFNSQLKEKRYNWAANITIPLMVGGEKQKIKAGYAGTYRDAEFASIGMTYVKDPMAASNPKFNETDGLPEYQLLGPDYLKPGYLFLYPTGPNASGGAEGEEYGGIQRLHAGYIMADASFLKKFRFIGGVRLEQNKVEVSTRTYNMENGYPVDSVVVYDKKNWLPSANLIYNLTDKMNIRLAYSQTLSRPDFRERSSFVYYEFKERTTYNGAKALRDALITNIDLRYEYYISANEIISVSGFYKKFDSPVELVVGGNPTGQVYYYFNLKSSTAYGAEVDFRKSLGFISPQSTFLNNVFVSGNATWMKANVKYNTKEMLDASNSVGGPQHETLPPDSRNRPLQGLSPYVYNAGIGYFGKPVGVNLSYNRYGRRIVAGGLYPYADQYENPRDVLDLQFSTRLLRNKLEIRLNISDLLQQPFIIYDNVNKDGIAQDTDDLRETINDDPKKTGYNADLDYTRYKSFRGSNISLNLGYTF